MDKQTVMVFCMVLLSIGLGYAAEIYFKKDIVTKVEIAWVGLFAAYVIYSNILAILE